MFHFPETRHNVFHNTGYNDKCFSSWSRRSFLATEILGATRLLGVTRLLGATEILGANKVFGAIRVLGATWFLVTTRVLGATWFLGTNRVIGVNRVFGDLTPFHMISHSISWCFSISRCLSMFYYLHPPYFIWFFSYNWLVSWKPLHINRAKIERNIWLKVDNKLQW